ncbi:sensor domain-containing diguanylate cyclase [Paenibacillus dauci]|uniref:sensor domain-containing diguanylate cyclase n=1 Tax=Paenibacillus dauci TaxID=1567106 RepID=UPI0006193C01|nr:diguanylate cyclase [Paenibacillus dauci]
MRKSFIKILREENFVGAGVVKTNLWSIMVFLLVVVVGLFYMNESVRSDYGQVKQAADLQIRLLSLENSLIDQETGQRGYLLTRDTSFLEPFDRGNMEYQAIANDLMERLESYPEYQGKMQQLTDAGIKWKINYGDKQVHETMSGHQVTSEELRAGKQQFDSFRDQKAVLSKEFEQLRNQLRATMLRNIVITLIGIGSVFMIFQGIMLYFIQRGLHRITIPIVQLDKAMSSYANGSISAEMPAYSSANEIGRLIHTFKEMRQEMQKDQRLLGYTYQMINTLNQAKSVQHVYQETLMGIWNVIECERISIITQNADRSFTIKSSIYNGIIDHKEVALGGEQKDVHELLEGGFSMIHEDWNVYRPTGTITDYLHAQGIRSSMHIILRKEARVVGVLNLMSSEQDHFSIQQKNRVEKLAPMIVTAIENARETDKIQRLAMRDGLTGLWNRRHFDESMQQLMGRVITADAERHLLSLILLDVDHFKSFNDNWGHQEGDLVLKHLGRVLNDYCRPGDLTVRYGGEEFAVLLPDTSLNEARSVAERLRKLIELESPSRKYAVTASFGVAEWDGYQSAEQLIQAADEALYRAKDEGRNRVCCYNAESADRATEAG